MADIVQGGLCLLISWRQINSARWFQSIALAASHRIRGREEEIALKAVDVSEVLKHDCSVWISGPVTAEGSGHGYHQSHPRQGWLCCWACGSGNGRRLQNLSGLLLICGDPAAHQDQLGHLWAPLIPSWPCVGDCCEPWLEGSVCGYSPALTGEFYWDGCMLERQFKFSFTPGIFSSQIIELWSDNTSCLEDGWKRLCPSQWWQRAELTPVQPLSYTFLLQSVSPWTGNRDTNKQTNKQTKKWNVLLDFSHVKLGISTQPFCESSAVLLFSTYWYNGLFGTFMVSRLKWCHQAVQMPTPGWAETSVAVPAPVLSEIRYSPDCHCRNFLISIN